MHPQLRVLETKFTLRSETFSNTVPSLHKRSVMADKNRAKTAFNKGKSNLEKGRPLQAMLSLTEAVKCDDEHYDSYLLRAEAFLQLEYHYLARDDAQKCIDLKPSAIEGYIKKGDIEYKAEAFKEARDTYEKALDIDSENAEILAALNKTNRAERGQMFRERGLHMQGIGVGAVVGVIVLVINEFFMEKQAIQGIVMKGVVFAACTYLGYAATKLYTDLLEQQRKLMLEPPKDIQSGKMFGDGGVPPKPDKNGHFFIDRDGKMFRFILNFMRDKKLCVPSSFEEYDQLLAEADFFQLYDLKEEVLSKMNPHPASVIAGEPLQKEVVVLRKDMYFFTCSSSRMGEWSDFQQKCVCAVEAKRETWMKLKSLASASLATLPVHHMRNDSKVSTCPGMESKIYPNESCPLVITSMIQDGFKLENTVTIDGSEYMIFTLMYSK